MTTGWGTDLREAPGAAWRLARDTAAGRGPAAVKDIPQDARPGVLVMLGAQARSFSRQAALQGVTFSPGPRDWAEIRCREVRELCAAALSGETVRVPDKLCCACTGKALARMAAALADAMAAAGIRRRDIPRVLDWQASQARHPRLPATNEP